MYFHMFLKRSTKLFTLYTHRICMVVVQSAKYMQSTLTYRKNLMTSYNTYMFMKHLSDY